VASFRAAFFLVYILNPLVVLYFRIAGDYAPHI
jgi:hypothetical protein